MLNPFPDLLIYGIFAPFLIRVAVGAVLLYLSVEHLRSRKDIAHILSPIFGKASRVVGIFLGVVEVIAGGLLVVGAWTQVAALFALAIALKSLFFRRSLKSLCPLSKTTYALILVMSLSLLLSGAGIYAFDIRL